MKKFYAKWDGDLNVTAILIISVSQIGLFFTVATIVRKNFYPEISLIEMGINEKVFAVSLFVISTGYNFINFKGKYPHLEAYWEKESNNQRIKRGILLVTALILPWVTFITVSGIRAA